jgi:hypothetical protein
VKLAVLGLTVVTAALFSATGQAQEVVACPAELPAAAHCSSGRDANGAYYWIAKPEPWNGVLVLHAHGGPRLPPPKPSSPVEDLVRFSVIVKEGFAWAGSSYRRGGYGVRMAAEDSDNLRKIFVQTFGPPARTIVHGQSWGGNVAAKLIEIYGTAIGPNGRPPYDGALLTSGVIAGGTRAYDFRADLRAVYQYYCRNHPRPGEPQYPLWMGLPAEATLTRKELEARVNECTGVAIPGDQRSEAQRQNLANVLSVIRIPERTLVAHLAWATFLFRDMVQLRLGGHNPFSNLDVRYAGSSDDDALNKGVTRFAADPAGIAALADDSDLTGRVAVPIVTMHAIDDPTAFVEHEAAYREVLERAGTSDRLVQTFTREHQHSYLSTPEYAAVLNALLGWIESGSKPTADAIIAACDRYRASYDGACLFDPAFVPKPFDERSYPRAAHHGAGASGIRRHL